LSARKGDVLLTEPIRDTIKRFARATDLHLGSIGLTASTVNAAINVQSPLAFELRVLRAGAIKKVIACMIEQSMIEGSVSKSEMARRMGTSRTQLDRLLDPAYQSVTLATIAKAASALGKKISISFGDLPPMKAA
jgi:DNA-binding phage protein